MGRPNWDRVFPASPALVDDPYMREIRRLVREEVISSTVGMSIDDRGSGRQLVAPPPIPDNDTVIDHPLQPHVDGLEFSFRTSGVFHLPAFSGTPGSSEWQIPASSHRPFRPQIDDGGLRDIHDDDRPTITLSSGKNVIAAKISLEKSDTEIELDGSTTTGTASDVDVFLVHRIYGSTGKPEIVRFGSESDLTDTELVRYYTMGIIHVTGGINSAVTRASAEWYVYHCPDLSFGSMVLAHSGASDTASKTPTDDPNSPASGSFPVGGPLILFP